MYPILKSPIIAFRAFISSIIRPQTFAYVLLIVYWTVFISICFNFNVFTHLHCPELTLLKLHVIATIVASSILTTFAAAESVASKTQETPYLLHLSVCSFRVDSRVNEHGEPPVLRTWINGALQSHRQFLLEPGLDHRSCLRTASPRIAC